jgi:bisphosphoglycerate-independent phosphoglycerate mutase (AlkP superfamily)
LRQLRLAETEKFAHVTFFLDGGSNQTFAGEDVICVPSPKGITPGTELSWHGVGEQVVRFNAIFDCNQLC